MARIPAVVDDDSSDSLYQYDSENFRNGKSECLTATYLCKLRYVFGRKNECDLALSVQQQQGQCSVNCTIHKYHGLRNMVGTLNHPSNRLHCRTADRSTLA